jgi:hypothetical protein
VQVDAAVLGAVARADRSDLERPARASRDQLAVRLDQPDDAAADRAKTGKSDAKRFGHMSPSSVRARRYGAAARLARGDAGSRRAGRG